MPNSERDQELQEDYWLAIEMLGKLPRLGGRRGAQFARHRLHARDLPWHGAFTHGCRNRGSGGAAAGHSLTALDLLGLLGLLGLRLIIRATTGFLAQLMFDLVQQVARQSTGVAVIEPFQGKTGGALEFERFVDADFTLPGFAIMKLEGELIRRPSVVGV